MAELTLLTGNILESKAEALVNTVNCEGYMGKGLAYQFKQQYPKTNKSYVETCRKGELKPSKIHTFKENKKIIINFPTKDKWREKSKIEYIESGMKALNEFVISENIHSIAIPPLGSGNGGLQWEKVKPIILKYTKLLNNKINIELYEPSLNYKAKIKQAPKLTLSHFILMNIKVKLKKFSKLRLQKTAFFLNLYAQEKFFKFDKHLYGPYSHSIEIISKDIKEFQDYHKFTTMEALDYAYKTLISHNVEKKLKKFTTPLKSASDIVNSASNQDVELYSTILYSVLQNKNSKNEIIKYIHDWSQGKKDKFPQNSINKALLELENKGILETNLLSDYCFKI